jgi:hypothetical protein
MKVFKYIFFLLFCLLVKSSFTEAACQFTYTINIAHTSCGQNNGVIQISNVSGGSAPYSFNLDNQGAVGSGNFTGVAHGSHIMCIIDANNCTFYLPTIIINNSSAITTASIYSLNTSCGSNNGNITIGSVIGGQAPYTYSLNSQGFVTNNVFTNLNPANYIVNVKDNQGCLYQSQAVNIAQSFGMQGVVTTPINTACDSTNGEVHINGMIGGTPPFLYNFNNQGYSSSADYYNLSVGSYSLYVSDSSNCIYHAPDIGVNPTDGINFIFTSHEDANCNQQNGSIVIDSIDGGVAPYTYNLNGAGYTTSNVFTQLAAGVYTLSVKDNAGCAYQAANVFIANNVSSNGTPSITIEAESPLICSNATTKIKIKDIQNQGLTPTYQWYMVVFGNTQLIAGANADELVIPSVFNGFSVNGVQFYVKMFSSDNCVLNNVAISNYVNLNVLNNNVDQTTDFAANVSQLTQAPYEVQFNNTSFYQINRKYTWGFGDGSIYEGVTPPKHVYALPGNYTVSMMVQDLSSGCMDTLIRESYIQIAGSSATCNAAVNIFPSDSIHLCYLEKKWIYTTTTASNPSFQWFKNGMLLGGEVDDSLLVSNDGIYSVVVYESQGCPIMSNNVHVRMSYQPTPIPEISSSGSIGDCSNAANITLTCSSGYSNYKWSTGASTQSITVNRAGLFELNALDVSGCRLSSNLVRLNNASIDVTDVCMVSYDSLANRNRIVWQKNLTQLAATDSFLVYEYLKNHSYRLIKQISKNAISDVLSNSSNPYLKSYPYFLASTDTCGNKVFSEKKRNNIFLQVNAGMGVYRQLSWSAYIDTIPFYYKIYRYTVSSVKCIDSVPSTHPFYIDQTSDNINAQYKVAVYFTDACVIENSTSYIGSFSNTAYNNVVAIPMQVGVQEQEEKLYTRCYPNPTSNELTVESSTNILSISITDIYGRTVQKYDDIHAQSHVLQVESLSNGFYQIHLFTANQHRALQFVKQ